MADLRDELIEIEAMLSSGVKSSKTFAYPNLLYLQERCAADTDDESSIGIIAQRAPSLLNFMLDDLFDDDEEIAVQACKCLGFMIYHPSIVATISVDAAGVIMQSLSKIIMNTKIKSVCNLGVWCISIQQFNASFVYPHFDLLMMAVVHALDNPFGSLSTTFEAVQAVLKLASQLNARMKDASSLWAPPIYRRLISEVKKERDVSDRCLLKLQSVICPLTPALAKVVVCDMKRKLLPGLNELQRRGLIIEAVRAWGWFILLIGPHALQNRRLLNEMLGLIEKALTAHRPQVQIAALVAWERLIDALIRQPLQACDVCVFIDNVDQKSRTFELQHGTLGNGFYKRAKLIMTPLVGIISSKCDTSVQSACMKVWCYLLFKLGTSVNCPAVFKITFMPLLKAVFHTRVNNKSNWLLNLCVDMVDDSVSAKCINGDQTSSEPGKQSMNCVPADCLRKHYPLKWLPWGVDQLKLYMDIVQDLSNQGVLTNACHDHKSLMNKSTIRIYRSIIKGVQAEIKSSDLNHDQVMLCLKTALEFITNLGENTAFDENTVEKLELSLRLIEATTEELDLAILGSLYRVTVTFRDLKPLPFNETKGVEVLNIYHDSLSDMKMRSHLVYLTTIYISVFAKVRSVCAEPELTLQKFHCYLKLILSSDSSQGVFQVILNCMYCYADTLGLNTWMVVGAAIKEIIGHSGDVSWLKSNCDRTGYLLAFCFLNYPLYICSSPLIKDSIVNYEGGKNASPASVSKDTDLVQVILEWRSMFFLIKDVLSSYPDASKCFAEDMCTTMNKHLQKNIVWKSGHVSNNLLANEDFYCIIGNAVICLLDQVTSDMNCKNDSTTGGLSVNLKNTLSFAASLIQAACPVHGTYQFTPNCLVTRVFSALTSLAGCLQQNQHIILFTEAIQDCLLHCIAHSQTWTERSHQMQLLWIEILSCLQKAQPAFVFNSTLLNRHAILLEKTLDHPDPSISEPTIKFWKSTYGKLLQKDYPKCMYHVLEKLSLTGKISFLKHDAEVHQKWHAAQQLYSGVSAPENCMVTTMNSRSSKRVKLVKRDEGGSNCSGSFSKRARLELTEHQKEVRRAQQGKERDCSGHGPGIRTYTGLDFSQFSEDSQELEDFRNTETILEMLKRPH